MKNALLSSCFSLMLGLTAHGQDVWTDRTGSLSGASTQLVDVAWSPEYDRYILLGQNGWYLGESGLTDWQAQTSPTASAMNAITVSGNEFVAVGNAGSLYVINGFTPTSWMALTSPAGSADLLCVQYVTDRFIAGCAPSAAQETQLIQKIGNGDWTRLAFPAASTGGVAHSIREIAFRPGATAGGGKWVFGTNTAGTVLTAPEDLSSITAVAVEGLGSDQRVIYGGGQFMMVADGETGQVWTSADGTSWTQATLPVTAPDLTGVCHDGQVYVAAGSTEVDSNPARPTLMTSADGITWVAAGSVPTSNRNLQFVQKFDGLWLTGGSAKTLFTGGRSTYTAAEISVLADDEEGPFEDGASTLAFTPNSILGATAMSRPVKIYNDDITEALTGLSLSITGPGAAAFSTTALSAKEVATSTPATFSVRYAPATAGTHEAVLHISSNDNDESDFEIALTGTAVAPTAPQITSTLVDALLNKIDDEYHALSTARGLNMTGLIRKDGATVKDTTVVAESGSSALTMDRYLPAVAGVYQVRYTNAQGTADSGGAYVGVIDFPASDLVMPEGKSFTLTCPVTLPKGATASYRWYLNTPSGGALADSPSGSTGTLYTGTGTRTLTVKNFAATRGGGGAPNNRGGSLSYSSFLCLVTMTTPATAGTRTISRFTNFKAVFMIPRPLFNPSWTLEETYVAEPVSTTILATPSPTLAAMRYSASGLPSGLVLNATTGQITGQARAPRLVSGNVTPYKVKFTISNAAGSATVEKDWLVRPLNPLVTGLYDGVISRDWGINSGLGGRFTLNVLPTGAVSGYVYLAGVKSSIAGYCTSHSSGNGIRFESLLKRSSSALGTMAFFFEATPSESYGTIYDFQWKRLDGPDVAAGSVAGQPGHVDANGLNARFAAPMACVTAPGNAGVWVVDRDNHCIRAITLSKEVTTVIGGPGQPGFISGPALTARLRFPQDMELLLNGDRLIADTGNHAVLRHSATTGDVTVVAGTGSSGVLNGPVATAQLSEPRGLTTDPAGNIYVTEARTIRKITPLGVVSTLAGRADLAGFTNGSGSSARFNVLGDICYEPVSKTLLACDQGGTVLRRITLSGAVTTYAGAPGTVLEAAGLLANTRFVDASSLLPDGTGGVLVTGRQQIYHLRASGMVNILRSFSERLDLSGICRIGGDLWMTASGTHQVIRMQEDTYSSSSVASIVSWRTPYTSKNLAPSGYAAYRTAQLTLINPQPGMRAPFGAGALTFTTSTSGATAWAGRLADGTAITGSSGLGASGEIAFHNIAHSNRASVQCLVQIRPTEPVSIMTDDEDVVSDAFKIPLGTNVSSNGNYHGGWQPHEVMLSGAMYQKTPGALLAQSDLNTGAGNMQLDFMSPVDPGQQLFIISGTLLESGVASFDAATNTNKVALKFTPGTGIFSGSYKLPAAGSTPARSGTIYGIVVKGLAPSGYHLLPRAPEPQSPVMIDSGLIRLNRL